MNSPLALAALILWLLLFFLAVQACRKWAKGAKDGQDYPTESSGNPGEAIQAL